MSDHKFYGKYRGTVTNVKDKSGLGRIRANVPEVTGKKETGWALPCLPFAGRGMGFLGLPTVGANVWIEFEHGDPENPIWTGCFWEKKDEVPPEALLGIGDRVLIRTAKGQGLLIDDGPGGGGIKIVAKARKIEIDNGNGAKVTLDGPKVTVNDGALEVT